MKKLLWLIPIIALIIGCGSTTSVYYPIAVGNTWVYQMMTTTIVQIDSVTADTTITTGDNNTEMTAETILNNGTPVFEIVTVITWDDTLMSDVNDTSYIEETEDYIFSYGSLDETVPDTVLVLPIEDGNTWTVHSDSSMTITARVMGQQDVQVPAGTYTECWRIAWVTTPGNDTSYNYYAPDIGSVLCEHTHADSVTSVEAISELTSVTIN